MELGAGWLLRVGGGRMAGGCVACGIYSCVSFVAIETMRSSYDEAGIRARDGAREELRTTSFYKNSIVLAGALITVCDRTAFAALLMLYRSNARSSRRCCSAMVVWRLALEFAFRKHFKTRVTLVCSFVMPAAREDVASGHLTLTRMLAVPPPALASRPG